MPAAQWQSGPASAGTKQNWLLTEIDLLQIWNKERILEILHLLRKLTLCPPRCESHLLISVSILILLRFQEVWRNEILPNTPPQSVYEMSAIYNNITAFIILMCIFPNFKNLFLHRIFWTPAAALRFKGSCRWRRLEESLGRNCMCACADLASITPPRGLQR